MLYTRVQQFDRKGSIVIYYLPRSTLFLFFLSALGYLIALPVIHYPVTTLVKCIPILCLLVGVLALKLPMLTSVGLGLALSCSLMGDLILTVPVEYSLHLGVFYFLLVHGCYIVLLANFFRFNGYKLSLYLFILGVSGVLFYFFSPYLGTLLVPLTIYFSVLLLMVFMAFQTKQGSLLMMLGAFNFWCSDSMLIYNLLLPDPIQLRIPVMLTYYLAQYLLVSGVLVLTRDSAL